MPEFTSEQIARFKILEQQKQIDTANNRKYYKSKKGQETRTRHYKYLKSNEGKALRAVYRKANPEKHKKYDRRGRLKRYYSLTETEYEKMLRAQEGVCAICQKPPTKKVLQVDHHAKTKTVRRLLCRACNIFLGYAQEDPGILRAAIIYLESFPHGK